MIQKSYTEKKDMGKNIQKRIDIYISKSIHRNYKERVYNFI